MRLGIVAYLTLAHCRSLGRGHDKGQKEKPKPSKTRYGGVDWGGCACTGRAWPRAAGEGKRDAASGMKFVTTRIRQTASPTTFQALHKHKKKACTVYSRHMC